MTNQQYEAELRRHRNEIDEWIDEAAADSGLDEDTVWHDVAVSYLTCEVESATMRLDLARMLGIPADMVGVGA